MRFLLCLVLLVGCQGKPLRYTALESYVIRYSVDMEQCPKDTPWQDYIHDYSESHGPIFNPEEKKEYAKFRVK